MKTYSNSNLFRKNVILRQSKPRERNALIENNQIPYSCANVSFMPDKEIWKYIKFMLSNLYSKKTNQSREKEKNC